MRWLWVPLAWLTFALMALVTDAVLLLVGGKGASNYTEDFCVEGGRGPTAEIGYGAPRVAGLGRLRCDYFVNGHETSTVYTAWWPFVLALVGFLVLLTVLVVAAVGARAVTRPSPTPATA